MLTSLGPWSVCPFMCVCVCSWAPVFPAPTKTSQELPLQGPPGPPWTFTRPGRGGPLHQVLPAAGGEPAAGGRHQGRGRTLRGDDPRHLQAEEPREARRRGRRRPSPRRCWRSWTTSSSRCARAAWTSDGVRPIAEKLEAKLRALGLERVETVGAPFDPRRHEAAGRREAPGFGAEVVCEESCGPAGCWRTAWCAPRWSPWLRSARALAAGRRVCSRAAPRFHTASSSSCPRPPPLLAG
ncbi:unnamed protein product [Prorocentrum cordatum]|uniref:GrpE protein homolog n=1 Tax=Prorocentrum cordatum TaxID=2364126 RepID=A0ABN9T4F9_9DINO|nr:unnamed protein product [Polarella glacialis]